MGLLYPSVQTSVLIGVKNETSKARTAVALTAGYDVTNKTKVLPCGSFSKLNLDVLYTMGATETTNSIEIRIRCSNDGVNFYRIPNEAVSGGTSTLTVREFTFVGADAAAATISIGLDIFYKFVEVSVKETGVVTNFGTVFVDATLCGQ